MACQGMKIILNLILLFIWFPGFPGIPGITSIKFPFPSLPVAICEFPFPSRKTGMWFSISLPVPGSLKAFPPHPCIQYTISVYVCVDQSRTDLLIFRYFVICSYVLILQIRLVGRLCRSWTELYWTLLLIFSVLCHVPAQMLKNFFGRHHLLPDKWYSSFRSAFDTSYVERR